MCCWSSWLFSTSSNEFFHLRTAPALLLLYASVFFLLSSLFLDVLTAYTYPRAEWCTSLECLHAVVLLCRNTDAASSSRAVVVIIGAEQSSPVHTALRGTFKKLRTQQQRNNRCQGYCENFWQVSRVSEENGPQRSRKNQVIHADGGKHRHNKKKELK